MSLDERLMLELQSIGLLPFEMVSSLLLIITLNDTLILNQLFYKIYVIIFILCSTLTVHVRSVCRACNRVFSVNCSLDLICILC